MSLLGGSVEASRAQRVERQQARYRDRGGIFKPADHNPLLDLLLARGVNGESPSRPSSPRRSRSRSTSPRRKQPSSHSQYTHSTQPPRALTAPRNKKRTGGKLTLTDPDGTVDRTHIELDHLSAPGPSVAPDPASSRMSRASKSTNKSSRTKSFRAAPSPHSSEDESPPVARSSNGRAPNNTPKSTKEKPSKPKQSRNRKVPPQNSVPTSHIDTSTDHAALGTTSRKRVQKKATTPKSKVAIVAKLPASHEDEGDGDANPAPARSRSKPSARTVQSLQSDSEQPCVLKKSTKGKVKVKSLEEVNPSSQGGRITAKKTTNQKTRGETNAQSDLDKGTTLETDAQASTSLGTKKRKKLPAPSTSNNLRVHLESDSEKHSPRSRSSSPEPPAKEPARKRHKARQAADDDGDKLPEEQESQIQNRRPSRKLGNAKDLKETREVSRSKAPPIPMPNGVRLKPKPRPRLSMFQPPPDDDTSDRDPIDFLS